MTNVFLGLIALGVLVMATIQVAVIVFAARAAKQVGDAVSRFEQKVQPIIANLETVSADAVRATAAASAHVERAGKMVDDLVTRVDETVKSAQETILRPVWDAFAFLNALRNAFGGSRDDDSSRRKRPSPVDDEEALFIG